MPEEGDVKPRTGSRSLSLYDKLPVLSDIHQRTEGNISAKFLAEHAARMRAWRQGQTFLDNLFSFLMPLFAGEVHLLVKEQESAVKAVKLERLVGNIGAVRGGRGSRPGGR